MSKRPDYRQGKVNDLAFSAANMLSGLMSEARGALPTCLNCVWHSDVEHYGEPRLYCQHYKAFPPPHVIVNACDGWADIDQVPF